MRTALLTTAVLLVAHPALAAEVEVGVGAGLAKDLGDRVSRDYARFGLGPNLLVPVRVALSPHAAVRATARAELGVGSDRVTWVRDIDGRDVRVGSDDHWAMVAAGGLTVGPELRLPVDGPVAPVLGAEAGAAWIGTYHSFSGESAVILDPKQNDLDDPGNVDPFTTNLTVLSDVHAGVVSTGDGPGFWAEVGYAAAYVRGAGLRKSVGALDARREAYGWNPLRVAAGVRIPL